MGDKNQELQESLRVLAKVFLVRLPGKLDEIGLANQQFKQEPNNREHWFLLHRLLHTMSGAAGTFGFPEIGTKARVLEAQIKKLLHDEAWDESQKNDFYSQVQNYIAESKLAMPAPEIKMDLDQSGTK